MTNYSTTGKHPFVITFAAVPGSGKTPIANVLSYTFNLPVFSKDAIRNQIRGDFIPDTSPKFVSRVNEETAKHLKNILTKQISFIYDTSVDRKWDQLKKELDEFGYNFFIISLNLSRQLLEKLYKLKNGHWEHLDRWIKDHKEFLKKYTNDIGLNITDENYQDRIILCINSVKNWLEAI